MRLHPTRAALRRLVLSAVLALPAASALAQACPRLPPRHPPPKEATPRPAVTAQGWLERLAELERSAAQPGAAQTQLLFLGDSLTQYWVPALFEQFYGHRRAANYGIAGDTTYGLLWRLQRLPLGTTLRPRLAVVLIGTNNTGEGSRPEDIALGIAESVRELRRRSPGTRVLLLGLLPRGADAKDPGRITNEAVNALVAGCADNRDVFYAAPGRLLVDAAGRLSEMVAPDRLHMSWVGYGILAAAMEPEIRRLLGEP